MKNDYRHQEILLLTNTPFSGREWLTRNNPPEGKSLSHKEQLAQACWNGLLPEILPEFFDNLYDKSMVLWEVNEAKHFIDLACGEFVMHPKVHFSVNPYVFIEVQEYN